MRTLAGVRVFERAVSMGWFRACCCLLASGVLAMAATERDVAEWVIRQGGRVVLEGRRMPLRDLSELPLGELHIIGVDLTNTLDRKSTRLNSSHLVISYAVFCL